MNQIDGKEVGSRERGLAYTNLAVMLFGLAGVLGKLSGLPAPLIVLGRVVIASLALMIVVRWLHLYTRPRATREAAVLLAQGVLLAIHWTTFFQAINVSSVAVGLLAFSSFPLFTVVFEPILLRQRPNLIQMLAALAIIPGIYLLVPVFDVTDSTTVGVLWGLASGMTFALLSVLNRWLARGYSSLVISLYQETVAAVVLLPALIWFPAVQLLHPQTLVALVCLGLFCTAFAHTLFIEGLKSITAQLASLIASLEPVWGIMFAFAFLHEIPTTRTLLGGSIIVFVTIAPALIGMCKRNVEV